MALDLLGLDPRHAMMIAAHPWDLRGGGRARDAYRLRRPALEQADLLLVQYHRFDVYATDLAILPSGSCAYTGPARSWRGPFIAPVLGRCGGTLPVTPSKRRHHGRHSLPGLSAGRPRPGMGRRGRGEADPGVGRRRGRAERQVPGCARLAHSDNKDNFTAYKLLIADAIDGKVYAVPRGIMAAGNVMQGSRGGVDLPKQDIDRVKSHLAKYYKKMGEDAPWERG